MALDTSMNMIAVQVFQIKMLTDLFQVDWLRLVQFVPKLIFVMNYDVNKSLPVFVLRIDFC